MTIKILHAYKDYFPVLGGIENHIRMLVTGLQQSYPEFELSVLTTNTRFQTRAEKIDGINVIKASRIATLASTPISLSLFREMRRQDFDIIHLHFPYPISELAYLFGGKTKHLIITYHSDIVKQKNLLRFYSPFLWKVLRRADVISLSNPNYARSSPYLKHFLDKCVTIPHGVDAGRFAATESTLAQAREIKDRYGTPIILFVGRMRYYKGVEFLIEAMRDINGKALIVGTGPREADLKETATRMGLNDKVFFLGNVPDEMLAGVYHASDVFVLPSTHRSESWGAVQLEAMASGVPVVCTELGTGTSFVNLHGETGFVVPPSDPLALAEAINRLISDPSLRKTLGNNARKRVEADLSVNVMIRKTAELYAGLSSKHA